MINFNEMGLSTEILDAIAELGFENPTPVQEEVIPRLLKTNNDLIALAQTGTGKTAAFGLPLIEQIDTENRNTQVLILSPTRELCVQIARDLIDFGKNTRNLHIVPVYGGASIENQIKSLKNGAQIIVATPGRLIDLIHRKAARIQHVNKIVLDEADEMLTMGFSDSINEILGVLPEEHNTYLFSATMSKEIAAIAAKFMRETEEIIVGAKNSGAENVKHLYYLVNAKDKYLALKRIADYNPNIYGIVFCRTRIETQEIADKLMKDGYNADALHGDLSQAQRDHVMNKFRRRNLRILVATDVAARGLDVDDLTHVINYNIPDDLEVYTHRSGRTGRAGKAGISIAIVNHREVRHLRQIEKMLGKSFVQKPVPSGREVCEKQLFHLIDKMENVDMEDSDIDSYLPVIYRKLEWIEKEDIIKRFVSLEFNRFLDYYKHAKDLNAPEERPERRKDKSDRKGRDDRRSGKKEREDFSRNDRNRKSEKKRDYRDRNEQWDDSPKGKAEKGFTRLFINRGKKDGLTPVILIDLLNQHTAGKKIPVGRIDLLKNFSFFEVPDKYVANAVGALDKQLVGKHRLVVEIAE